MSQRIVCDWCETVLGPVTDKSNDSAERGFHVDTRTQLEEMAPGPGELHVAVHVVPAERGKHVCDSCARKALERSLRTGEDRG